MSKKTATIVISGKDPDLLWGIEDEKLRGALDSFFEFGEYYSVEIEVRADGRVVGGRLIPMGEQG